MIFVELSRKNDSDNNFDNERIHHAAFNIESSQWSPITDNHAEWGVSLDMVCNNYKQ